MTRRPGPAPLLSAADVRSARFQATRFREGYDQEDVDAFLDRLAGVLEALEEGREPAERLSPEGVLDERFTATKFRDGYDQDEVDDFLDRAVETLRAQGAGDVVTGPGGARRADVPPVEPVTAREVRTARLGRSRWREGYAIAEVDAFLRRVVTALTDLEAGRSERRMTVDDVRSVRFSATRLREGYVQDEVDDLLERVVRTLEPPAPTVDAGGS
ncbi:DivIVA domain-containing protein [Thalassiella azotivora]